MHGIHYLSGVHRKAMEGFVSDAGFVREQVLRRLLPALLSHVPPSLAEDPSVGSGDSYTRFACA